MSTLIRFTGAWLTGDYLDGIIKLGALGQLHIEEALPNPDGDGWRVSGRIDVTGVPRTVEQIVDDFVHGRINNTQYVTYLQLEVDRRLRALRG